MKNDDISYPYIIYPFLVFIVSISVLILHAAKKGIKISKYLKSF